MILVTQGYHFIIDDEDFSLIKSYNLDVCGFKTHKYLRLRKQIENRKIRLLFHRFITNCPSDQQVDHINGNTFDNRKENLRVCNHAQNHRNLAISKNSKTGVPGVRKIGKKYKAEIGFNNKKLYIGTFSTLKEAEIARKNKEKDLYGEFSRMNYAEEKREE